MDLILSALVLGDVFKNGVWLSSRAHVRELDSVLSLLHLRPDVVGVHDRTPDPAAHPNYDGLRLGPNRALGSTHDIIGECDGHEVAFVLGEKTEEVVD